MTTLFKILMSRAILFAAWPLVLGLLAVTL
jgi:hypothetical protein